MLTHRGGGRILPKYLPLHKVGFTFCTLYFLDVDLDAPNTFIQEFLNNPLLIDEK